MQWPTRVALERYGPANKMGWISDVHFTDVDGSLGDFLLEKDLMYQDSAMRLWITPKGFVSDLSSFPWFVRMFTPVTILSKSPWLHDYLYRQQPEGVTRKQADLLYRDGAVDEGMSKSHANRLYAGLRVGGWLTWRSHRSKLESK